jgi:hypothetical protein
LYILFCDSKIMQEDIKWLKNYDVQFVIAEAAEK